MPTRYEVLKQEIEAIEQELQELPKGKLLISKNGNSVKWYKSNKSKPIYIPKSKREYAEKLALRHYLTLKLEELKQEMTSLQVCDIKEKESDKLIKENTYFAELLKPYFRDFSGKIEKWIQTDYEKSTLYPEKLIHQTLSGEFVRSKSEAMIANTFYINKIPYRYEPLLQIGEMICYPDFQVLHPKTFREIYWEHFGMMDKVQYRQMAYDKLHCYGRINLYPTINMICTFETKDNPLNLVKVQQLVKEHFIQ